MCISKCAALSTLHENVSLRVTHHDIRILLFDNTPGGGHPGALPNGVQYESAGFNAGLAAAYNRALDLAQESQCDWLLLLDQDTILPKDFLELLSAQIKQYESHADVVALVPVVRSRGIAVSPKKVGFFGLKALPEASLGPQFAEVTAINSGTALRCDFIRSIGGFNRAYWLDYLDHWLFRQVYAAGKKVAVWDCTLEHHLSVQNYRENITMTRYRSILAGESGFMTTHKSKLQIPLYLLRLLVRSARMAMQRQPDMAWFTLATVARIALHPMRSLEDNPR